MESYKKAIATKDYFVGYHPNGTITRCIGDANNVLITGVRMNKQGDIEYIQGIDVSGNSCAFGSQTVSRVCAETVRRDGSGN